MDKQEKPYKRRKIHRIARVSELPKDLAQISIKASYVGSAEHKSYPSEAGPAQLRSDATKCEHFADFKGLTEQLRASIKDGIVSEIFESGFPKYVWGKMNNKIYEARHIGAPAGRYKGWSIEPASYPIDPENKLNL